jgi:2'-5' RNA ligase
MISNGMKFFAGIVPPEDIYHRLLQIQKQFGDNRLEPHITLRPPVSPLNDDAWMKTISEIAATIKPFTIHLTQTDYFGKRVLFVSVDSEELVKLHHLLIPALKIFEPKEANKGSESFHPHLTLGRTWCGFTEDDFRNMQQLANTYLSAGNVSFEVKYIRIYHKPEHQGRYQLYKDLPLGTPN